MAIVFGHELGLTKSQLRDLGYIALFHDAGMGTLSRRTAVQARRADRSRRRRAIAKSPLVAVRNILKEKSINRSTLLRLVTTFEHKSDFGTAVRDAPGQHSDDHPQGEPGRRTRR